MNCSCVDVRPERSSHLRTTRTNNWTRVWRPMFVVGISCTRPKTRAFVTERTWAYQTKSAFSDLGYIPLLRSICNEDGQMAAASDIRGKVGQLVDEDTACAQHSLDLLRGLADRAARSIECQFGRFWRFVIIADAGEPGEPSGAGF